MSSIQPVNQNERRIKSIWTFTSRMLFASIFFVCGAAAAAEDEASENAREDGFWYAVVHGKPTLNMRLRVEVADQDNPGANTGLKRSEAYTLRTRLGYGTKPWKGLMAYAEAENTTAVATNQYNDGTEGTGTGQTTIADPTNTEVNQVFLNFKRKDWLDTNVTLGRQRIILDDSRFIGNVGWRQNEQTFDAVRGSTSLGVKDLDITYAYMRYVRRIFGDQGSSVSSHDWRANNHVVNASYKGFDVVDITAFAYLLEFNRANGNSSASVGFRLNGAPDITDDLKLIYEASYSYQTDYDNNPLSYNTHYFMGKLKLAQSDWGALGVGYELLGSDDGDAQFVTPLATAHKFNGWADVFLNNGGVNGLQDVFASISPKLPWKLKGSLIYHHFRSDHDNKSLGDEVDIVLKRSINKYLSVLTKAAYFDGNDNGVPDNIWRWWLQADVKF